MIEYKLEKNKKILVFGGKGMVGSSIVRLLNRFSDIKVIVPTHDQVDLLNIDATSAYIKYHNPDVIIMAAARVGGIIANNDNKAIFLYENLLMNTNVIHSAYINNIQTLCFLGSSCIYPRECKQPIIENDLLSGPLESTNEGYALAKITGLKLCEHYRKDYGVKYFSVMPTNLYGPGDNYNSINSHVIPAIINKCETARILNSKSALDFLGDGSALREFLYVDDLALAIVKLLEISETDFNIIPNWINIGSGEEISIKNLIEVIKIKCGIENTIVFNEVCYMNGTPKKILDSSLIRSLGWQPITYMTDGLDITIRDYRQSLIDNTLRR